MDIRCSGWVSRVPGRERPELSFPRRGRAQKGLDRFQNFFQKESSKTLTVKA